MRRLFLDDERVPGDVTWITLHDGPYDIVRSMAEFIAYVEEHGVPDVISFDNDLGLNRDKLEQAQALVVEITHQLNDENIDWAGFLTTDLQNKLKEVTEPQGRDCAKWLVEQILDGKIAFNPDLQYTVHSKNTVAGPWIKQYLDQFMEQMKSH